MENKISIYDIAKYLDISPATVSYVINGVNKVSEKTKEKVLKAIEELGYVPNYTARALSTGKSRMIGILLPVDDASIAFLQNPFYVEFIGGMEKVISKYDYDLVIGIYNKTKNIKEWVMSRNLDGVVIVGSCEDSVYQELKSIELPIVFTDDYKIQAQDFNVVISNDEDGMYLATKYLINMGHTQIGFVGDPVSYLIDKKRYEGYKKALEEVGIEVDDNHLFITDATFTSGYNIGEEIINGNVSSIVCSGDILAIGIMKKIKELGYDIPKDLSIIGFDDIQDANFVYPGLTTVKQDIGEKGYRSAQIIIDVLENSRKGRVNINLESSLVIRDSVCRVKKNKNEK